MSRFAMITAVKINLFFLALVYSLFLRFTAPSPTIQPLLHAVFGTGILLYYASAYGLTRRFVSQSLAWVLSLIPLLLFGIVWTIGIVVVTRWMSWLISTQNSTEAVLLYGTSGTQFFNYSDTQLCWVLLLPVALVTILIHFIFRKRQ